MLRQLGITKDDLTRKSVRCRRLLIRCGFGRSAKRVATALKLALHRAISEGKVTKASLARSLGADEKEARRILDPRAQTKVATLERALTVLGKRAVLTIEG